MDPAIFLTEYLLSLTFFGQLRWVVLLISRNFRRKGVDEGEFVEQFDVIVGADVLVRLYDPKELAKTIHTTIRREGKGYLSIKRREDLYLNEIRGCYEGIVWWGGRGEVGWGEEWESCSEDF